MQRSYVKPRTNISKMLHSFMKTSSVEQFSFNVIGSLSSTKWQLRLIKVQRLLLSKGFRQVPSLVPRFHNLTNKDSLYHNSNL